MDFVSDGGEGAYLRPWLGLAFQGSCERGAIAEVVDGSPNTKAIE